MHNSLQSGPASEMCLVLESRSSPLSHHEQVTHVGMPSYWRSKGSFCLALASSQTRLVAGKDISKDQMQNEPMNVKTGLWWFCYSLTLKDTL